MHLPKHVVILCALFILSSLYASSQDLEVGKPCPDILLNNIHYFKTSSAHVSDFRGKWLILDFWHQYCTSCFRSFPENDSLQREFQKNIQFILIGMQDPQNRIQAVYQKFRQKFKLELPIMYDSALFKLWKISSCPYMVVIDEKGIVRATTVFLTKDNITDLLSGKTPVLSKAFTDKEHDKMSKIFDSRKPYLVQGNGGQDTDFIYRSVLHQWKDGDASGQTPFINGRYKNKFQMPGMIMPFLYRAAYGDTVAPWPDETPNDYGSAVYYPINETSDPSALSFEETGKNVFGYSLIVPPSKGNPLYLQECMQRDLQNYFGWRVIVENREMPYWKIVASRNALATLKTTGGLVVDSSSTTSLNFHNVPFQRLVEELWYEFQLGPPFINETGITSNIDLQLEGIFTDFEDFRAALKQKGIELILGRKIMKAIVLKDPINPKTANHN